ncbi:MAG: hypothetical protein KDC49_18280 [Saprospiraceae bacterium]|nr:hypothetical protein [Saprospiraceae bacterium]
MARRVIMVEAGGIVMAPQNAFKRNVTDRMWGIGFGGLVQVKKAQPLFAGMSFGFANIDKLSSPVNIQYNTGFIEEWDSETKSSVFHLNLYSRYYIEIGTPALNPFLELNTGGNLFYTTTTLSLPNSEETSSNLDESDFVLFYGGGFGASIAFSEGLYVSFSINYNLGLSANYFVRERNSIDPLYGETLDAFELRKSATDMTKTNIVLTYSF